MYTDTAPQDTPTQLFFFFVLVGGTDFGGYNPLMFHTGACRLNSHSFVLSSIKVLK